MLDNLRDQASSTPFFQDDNDLLPPEEIVEAKKQNRFSITSFGLTPQRLFILSFMLLAAVCLLGTMFLLVAGKISLPF